MLRQLQRGLPGGNSMTDHVAEAAGLDPPAARVLPRRHVVAVALGNAPASAQVRDALNARADHPSAIVREHVAWALARQGG